MKILFSLLALLLYTDSCDSAKTAMDSNQKSVQNERLGSYTISRLENRTTFPNEITLAFDEETNKVSGFAGCNSFFGTYTITNDNITFSNIASSKKYCPYNDVSTVEDQFLNSLSRISTFKIEDNVLKLFENGTLFIEANQKNIQSQKSEKPPKDMTMASNTNMKDQKEISVVYEAISRGSFQHISISKSNISMSKDRNLKDITQSKCPSKDWEEIERLLDNLNPKEFQQLKAPTNQRLYDGAAHATLSLKQGDDVITTPSFDHGHPPKAIEALVNKVLSMAQLTKKQ